MLSGGLSVQGRLDPFPVFPARLPACIDDFNMHAGIVQGAADGNRTAARRGNAVFHRVLQQRLDRQQRQDAVQRFFLDLPVHGQVRSEALLDEIDVSLRHFHLFPQGYQPPVLPRHGGVQQHGQGGHHGGNAL